MKRFALAMLGSAAVCVLPALAAMKPTPSGGGYSLTWITHTNSSHPHTSHCRSLRVSLGQPVAGTASAPAPGGSGYELAIGYWVDAVVADGDAVMQHDFEVC